MFWEDKLMDIHLKMVITFGKDLNTLIIFILHDK